MRHTVLVDWTDQPVYIGLDVHVKSWQVCLLTATLEHATFTQPPEARLLAAYLHRHFPGAAVHVAYEAGLCGFQPYRHLTALGIPCLVVHPPDVPTTDVQRRRKTDRRDARKLAQALRAHQLRPIAVPTPAREADRSLTRLRSTLSKERTRTKNRIKSWCRIWGAPLPAGCQSSHWSQAGRAALRALEGPPPTARQTLHQLVDWLETLDTRRTVVTQQIKALAATPPYQIDVALLTTIPGLGVVSALTWLTELGPLDRFAGFDQLCSYVGLVPGEHSSGATRRVTGLDRRGNARLRALLVQNSWTAVRKDPALLACYNHLTRRLPKQQAIIRIARKVLRRLYRVLRTREPYVLGVQE